ncbi:hypothetical protein OIE63_18480 [Streptomyces sp. NBC_01795]|uniref:hypothetical protein n=1 Tax=Streptomyces sp. NBC_01795 TaxID=2975943 RepID=UPI002DD89631|nr:hypothetical protein [Streptomyces sp. NBC_01795]WSA93344.1 hypothetical protein OIE63_18480 [Streptomyces sp. NBC_01795]
MSVSLYYYAYRTTPLTGTEAADVEHIAAAHRAAFPYQDEESLYLYEGGGSEPDEILAGSTKLPNTFDRLMPVIDHLLASVTELRRALPDAEWRVHVDDVDIPWDEDDGYALPEEAPSS